MTRITWVDNAKAIAIYLVVLGHFHYSYAPLPFKDVIYAFHIPAFLFITGFLLPADFPRMAPGRFLSRYIALYLRAYVFFSAIAIAIWWASKCAEAGGIVSPWPAVAGALYGIAGPGSWLVHHNAPLWYFPFLITSMIAAWLAARLPRPAGVALILAYAALGFLYQGPRLPWDIEIAGIGASFVLAGHLTRRAGLTAGLGAPWQWVLAPLLLALLVWITRANGGVNVNGADFGASPALFYLGAFAGIALIVLVSALLPASRIATRVSLDTLVIFALHFYLVMVFARLPHPDGGAAGVAGAVLSAAVSVLLCLGLARVLKPVLDRLVTR